MPKRIQMTRNKPWREEHLTAVIVDRRTAYGNPFTIVPVRRSGPFDVFHGPDFIAQATDLDAAREIATRRFRDAVRMGWGEVPWPDQIRADLAGRDLACWCPLDTVWCHATVLLDIAAGGTP